MASFVRRRAFLCAIALLLFCAATAIPQPKLESSSLGVWRGSWFSLVDPTKHGPLLQSILTERNRRVDGFIEWLATDWRPVFAMELQGTTSASCNFNYQMKGLGAAEGMRMTFHGEHMPHTAMGGYTLFGPGLFDQGVVAMIQNANSPDAPNVEGHYMGSYESSVNPKIMGPFTFYVFDGSKEGQPGQDELGNYWGVLEVEDPLMDRELYFYFAGRIDEKNHSLVVGDGDAGIFMVDMNYMPAMRGESGEIEKNAMFAGTYHVMLADGSEDMGSFAVEHNPNFGKEPPPIVDGSIGQ